MGRGGSRFGAGRPGLHPKVERHYSLDVRRLAADNMLRTGEWSLVWRDALTNEKEAGITIFGGGHCITLAYSISGEPVRTEVSIVKAACGFGGERPWFACPRCHRRVAKLYLRSKRFACRHCHGLRYSSQSGDICGTASRKLRKLEARLGPDWQRPRYMHFKTYMRLMHAILDCQRKRSAWFDTSIANLNEGLEKLGHRFPGLLGE